MIERVSGFLDPVRRWFAAPVGSSALPMESRPDQDRRDSARLYPVPDALAAVLDSRDGAEVDTDVLKMVGGFSGIRYQVGATPIGPLFAEGGPLVVLLTGSDPTVVLQELPVGPKKGEREPCMVVDITEMIGDGNPRTRYALFSPTEEEQRRTDRQLEQTRSKFQKDNQGIAIGDITEAPSAIVIKDIATRLELQPETVSRIFEAGDIRRQRINFDATIVKRIRELASKSWKNVLPARLIQLGKMLGLARALGLEQAENKADLTLIRRKEAEIGGTETRVLVKRGRKWFQLGDTSTYGTPSSSAAMFEPKKDDRIVLVVSLPK